MLHFNLCVYMLLDVSFVLKFRIQQQSFTVYLP